jgi:hypothetical protein
LERLLAFFVFGDVEKETGFFETRPVFLPSVYDRSKRGLFLENALRFFRVVPEIGARGNLIELLDTFLLAVEVKDASAKARVALPSGKVALWFLLTSLMLFYPLVSLAQILRILDRDCG